MKIIYEPLDVVEVEDNSDAGEFAARYVVLVEPIGLTGAWIVKNPEDSSDTGTCHERWFRP